MSRFGSIKVKKDLRDYKLVAKAITFPNEFELPITRIKNQGMVGSCVAHSITSMIESRLDNDEQSVGFVYGYRPTGYYQSEGMYVRDALNTARNIGSIDKINLKEHVEMPTMKKIVDDKFNSLLNVPKSKISSYARIYTSNQIKSALMTGVCVPVTIGVVNDIILDKEYRIIPEIGKSNSGHCMLIYGWNENGFKVLNSWGSRWGNKGTCIMPYDYKFESAWAVKVDNEIKIKQGIFAKIIAFIRRLA